MKKIYSANDLIEAQIVLNLLEHAFIPARLFNQYAQGAAGDIPSVHAYPEVWIIRDEDYERSNHMSKQRLKQVISIASNAVKKIPLIFSCVGNVMRD